MSKLLGQLSLNETDEILYLSSEEEKYFKNHHTLKVNDVNFEKMSDQANKKRYVVLGNQIQPYKLQNIFNTAPFYFYTEFLGSNMIDFSSATRTSTI